MNKKNTKQLKETRRDKYIWKKIRVTPDQYNFKQHSFKWSRCKGEGGGTENELIVETEKNVEVRNFFFFFVD